MQSAYQFSFNLLSATVHPLHPLHSPATSLLPTLCTHARARNVPWRCLPLLPPFLFPPQEKNTDTLSPHLFPCMPIPCVNHLRACMLPEDGWRRRRHQALLAHEPCAEAEEMDKHTHKTTCAYHNVPPPLPPLPFLLPLPLPSPSASVAAYHADAVPRSKPTVRSCCRSSGGKGRGVGGCNIVPA